MTRWLGVISEGEHRQFRCLHVLEQVDPAKENGFRWHCLKPDCGKWMYRKNGVVARMLPKKQLENKAKVG